jgi:hypothetical protein
VYNSSVVPAQHATSSNAINLCVRLRLCAAVSAVLVYMYA